MNVRRWTAFFEVGSVERRVDAHGSDFDQADRGMYRALGKYDAAKGMVLLAPMRQ